jgi:hypothetical protein
LSRLSGLAFGALVVATVGAFFVSQHLKVSTPLIAGIGPASPGAINPVAGPTCGGVSHREARFSFYLLHKADSVDVYVVDESGNIIRTLASGRHMRRGVRIPDGVFYWNGREDDHRLAPDGTYGIEVGLIHQGRTVTLGTASGPVTIKVKKEAPRPVVERVTPQLIPRLGRAVTIRYAGNEGRGGTIRLYRTDVGSPHLVKTFLTPWKGQSAVWDGKIHGRPAPPGTYLVGMEVTDAACNTGRFPPRIPPAPGSTAHDGVTVRYLAAEPPLDPVAAGTSADVRVDSSERSYRWSLVRAGSPRPVASGADSAAELKVPLPGGRPGLYELRLRAGSHSTAVPLVASGPARAPLLVVLPALTWQGLNPVDDHGDGIPDTLSTGGPVALGRPFSHGLPPGFADQAGVLSYLDASHRHYELTTDVGLIDGAGPRLNGHTTVVLAGAEQWLPATIAAALRSYVTAGGHALSFGLDSLQRGVTVRAGEALAPTAARTVDALGATRGTPVDHNHSPLTATVDQLGIFQNPLPGYRSYQPLPAVASPSQLLAAAGAKPNQPSIIGYDLGRGTVFQVAVDGFGASLSQSAAARALTGRILKSF